MIHRLEPAVARIYQVLGRVTVEQMQMQIRLQLLEAERKHDDLAALAVHEHRAELQVEVADAQHAQLALA